MANLQAFYVNLQDIYKKFILIFMVVETNF